MSSSEHKSFVEVEPDKLGWQDSYKLLTGSIVPRPIAFVSTRSKDGVNNLAAFSFFNAVCPKPFVISFSPMRRSSSGDKKDTLRNVEETGEFVVNIVSEDLGVPMSKTNPEFPADVDEFEVAGLTPIPSDMVNAPRVLESSIQMECKLLQVVHIGEDVGAGSLVLGRVVKLHIAEQVYEDGKINPDALGAIARMAGDVYARTKDRFSLPRATDPVYRKP